MKNLLSVSEAISAKILFIIEENGRDAEYTRACAMWNMDIEIEHIPFRGFQRAVTEQYDVVVIDDYLAGKSGYTLAMEIMDRCDVIMIMLGKDMDDVSVVGAFRMGIMDYLPAGTSPTQLAARSVALVNRYRESNARVRRYADGRICAANLTLDTRNGILDMDGRQISLLNTEAIVLQVLMENSDILMSKKEIYEKAWGETYVEGENSVAMHISKLRKKMEEDGDAPKYIETKWGAGYRFLSKPQKNAYC